MVVRMHVHSQVRRFIEEWELESSPAPSSSATVTTPPRGMGRSATVPNMHGLMRTPGGASKPGAYTFSYMSKDVAAATIQTVWRGVAERTRFEIMRAALRASEEEARARDLSSQGAQKPRRAWKAQHAWVRTSPIRMQTPMPSAVPGVDPSDTEPFEPIAFDSFLAMKAMYLQIISDARHGRKRPT